MKNIVAPPDSAVMYSLGSSPPDAPPATNALPVVSVAFFYRNAFDWNCTKWYFLIQHSVTLNIFSTNTVRRVAGGTSVVIYKSRCFVFSISMCSEYRASHLVQWQNTGTMCLVGRFHFDQQWRWRKNSWKPLILSVWVAFIPFHSLLFALHTNSVACWTHGRVRGSKCPRLSKPDYEDNFPCYAKLGASQASF